MKYAIPISICAGFLVLGTMIDRTNSDSNETDKTEFEVSRNNLAEASDFNSETNIDDEALSTTNPGLGYAQGAEGQMTGMEAAEEAANEEYEEPAPVIQSRPVASNGFDCSIPKTCPMMRSCDEAMFYLNTCGDSARDRDGDGIPCEKICG